jgi:hypothetical protein
LFAIDAKRQHRFEMMFPVRSGCASRTRKMEKLASKMQKASAGSAGAGFEERNGLSV